MIFKCERCADTFWVCEAHIHMPWGGNFSEDDATACHCGGAGCPCDVCNREAFIKMPPGFIIEHEVQ